MLRRLRMLLALLLVIATASAWVASYGGEVFEEEAPREKAPREEPVPVFYEADFPECHRHIDFENSAGKARSTGHGVFWDFGAPQRYVSLRIQNGNLLVTRGFEDESRCDCLNDASVYQVRPIFSCLVNPDDWTGLKDVTILVKIWLLFLVSVAWLCGNIYRGPLRYWRRLKRGLCVSCGYDLRGTESGVCSECGKEIRVQKKT